MDRDKRLRIFTYINRRKDQQLQAIITEYQLSDLAQANTLQ